MVGSSAFPKQRGLVRYAERVGWQLEPLRPSMAPTSTSYRTLRGCPLLVYRRKWPGYSHDHIRFTPWFPTLVMVDYVAVYRSVPCDIPDKN